MEFSLTEDLKYSHFKIQVKRMMKYLKNCLLTTLVDSLLAKYAYLAFYYTGSLAVLAAYFRFYIPTTFDSLFKWFLE